MFGPGAAIELKALEAEVGRKTNEASSAEANVKALTDELDVLRRQAAEATKSLDHAHAQLEATRHETEGVVTPSNAINRGLYHMQPSIEFWIRVCGSSLLCIRF